MRKLSPVLAVDVFDKFNFTGARVPRFEDIQDEFPRELESSVSFPADVFKPPERKGETTAWAFLLSPLTIQGGGHSLPSAPRAAVLPSHGT